jgi:hypothetical protein
LVNYHEVHAWQARTSRRFREPVVEDADEEIRRRADEISQSGDSGTPEENWHRAACEIGQRDDDAAT